ncbi:MAG: LysE family transporter [Chloroflexi bacterium]|nr:LysE family transporter [Chloroflexota bacterium]
MDPSLLARSMALGFTIAAAVGPISLLTIRRTLAHGRVYGLASGLGVALADGTYAAIAAFGLAAVTNVLVGSRTMLGVIGGAVLMWLAWRTLRSRPAGAARDAAERRPGLVAAMASIYGLTMTNPSTILSFAALFAALGIGGGGSSAAASVTIGVIAGSALWWVVLTTMVGWLRSRITTGGLVWINRLSGAALLVFGIGAIVAGLAPPG